MWNYASGPPSLRSSRWCISTKKIPNLLSIKQFRTVVEKFIGIILQDRPEPSAPAARASSWHVSNIWSIFLRLNLRQSKFHTTTSVNILPLSNRADRHLFPKLVKTPPNKSKSVENHKGHPTNDPIAGWIDGGVENTWCRFWRDRCPLLSRTDECRRGSRSKTEPTGRSSQRGLALWESVDGGQQTRHSDLQNANNKG